MSWRRFSQAVLWLLAAIVTLLVGLYAFSSGSDRDQRSTAIDGPTPYPSIVLFPTLVPPAAPDSEPHVLRLANARMENAKVPTGYAIRAVLSDGSVLSESGDGPATVARVDGTVVSVLPIPLYAHSVVSADSRYVAWIADDHMQVYDAETARVSSEPPQGARFDGSMRDGNTVLGDSAGAWPESPPSATGRALGEATLIVDGSGAVTDRLPVPNWTTHVSPDERRIAWAAPDGLHIFERSDHADRIHPDVTIGNSEIAWSPQGTEIAYLRLSANDAVLVWVVDIVSGEQHRVYSGEAHSRIQRLAFVANHELQWQTAPAFSATAQYDLPGARYAIADDGSGGHYLDDPATLWGECGPSCGMPPAGYENADGLAHWCEQPHDGACIYHLVFVDRGASVVRDLAAGDFAYGSFSPDHKRLAILFSNGTDQALRIFRLGDFTSSDFPLGFTYANNVAWFPNGESLLVWASGGN